MVQPAQRHGELVAHPASERRALRKAEMMCVTSTVRFWGEGARLCPNQILPYIFSLYQRTSLARPSGSFMTGS